MLHPRIKACDVCLQEKPLTSFPTSGKNFDSNGDRYRRRTCSACVIKAQKRNNPERAAKIRQQESKAKALRRKDPTQRYKFILRDSKASDRKRGFVSNLTQEFILLLIQQPCHYCGDVTLQRSLDRIDNALGHTMNNVVSSCIRCNYIRRDMPYEAFVSMRDALRFAREQGLFGAWTGRCR